MNALTELHARAVDQGRFSGPYDNNSASLYIVNSDARLPHLRGPLFNAGMKTVEEIRRDWLLELIKQYGTIAALNEALGRDRTDATLSQIKNRAPDSKTGTPKQMGSPIARQIEEKLGLERGRLDNPKSDLSDEAREVAAAYEKLPAEIKLEVRRNLAMADLAARGLASQNETAAQK